MDTLHNANEQPPTLCQPRTDVTRLSEVWGNKKGKRLLPVPVILVLRRLNVDLVSHWAVTTRD